MKISQLNDYIQTLATVGAIAGLLLVAYEIRQSTRIALAESIRDGQTVAINVSLSGLESGISGAIIKAETHPEALTPEEMTDLSLWLKANIQAFQMEYTQINVLGVDVEEELSGYDKYMERSALKLFGSAWSRAWFYEEQSSLPPWIAERILRAIERSPLNGRTEGFKRMDEIAPTIE